MGALSHLRVLDLSRVLAGPWAGQILADLGAEVIKVERPGSGDDTRAWGPPFLKDAYGENTTEASYYLSANRNKESVTIDFTRPEGQKLVRDLAAKSDILIENFKVGGLAAYGFPAGVVGARHGTVKVSRTTWESRPKRVRAPYAKIETALGTPRVRRDTWNPV
jgi:crotonobetainyl-CoA:carnitine CoA-transferase CaiB-like acyl-CoA transferase